MAGFFTDCEQNVGGRRELVGKREVAVSSWMVAKVWTNALAAANKRKKECKKPCKEKKKMSKDIWEYRLVRKRRSQKMMLSLSEGRTVVFLTMKKRGKKTSTGDKMQER